MASSPQPQDFQLLLEVFQRGLKIGLISREEIVSWADNIIATTGEPDYFFIELSLSSNTNALIEVLNQYVKPSDNPICDRVLLALIYYRRSIFEVEETEKITTLVGSMASWVTLTSFENNVIWEFQDYQVYYLPDVTQLQVELINFLAIYKAFTLENHEEWVRINEQVLQLLEEEEIKVNAVNESIRKEWEEKETKKKSIQQLKNIGIFILVLFCFGMFYSLFDSGSTNNFSLFFILSYILLRAAYAWWRRRKGSDRSSLP